MMMSGFAYNIVYNVMKERCCGVIFTERERDQSMQHFIFHHIQDFFIYGPPPPSEIYSFIILLVKNSIMTLMSERQIPSPRNVKQNKTLFNPRD